MKVHRLSTDVLVPRPLDEVQAFFADPRNLSALTPPWLEFRILTPEADLEMRRGAVFDYRILLRGLPLRWRTLISAWQPPHRFVDEQVRGPYSLWVHEHLFEESPEGTWVRDRVRYGHPGGSLANRLLVRPDLERIFRYRCQRMEALWPARAPAAAEV